MWRAEHCAWPVVSVSCTFIVTSVITTLASGPTSLGYTWVPLDLPREENAGKILNCLSAPLTGPSTPGRSPWLVWLQGLFLTFKDAKKGNVRIITVLSLRSRNPNTLARALCGLMGAAKSWLRNCSEMSASRNSFQLWPRCEDWANFSQIQTRKCLVTLSSG